MQSGAVQFHVTLLTDVCSSESCSPQFCPELALVALSYGGISVSRTVAVLFHPRDCCRWALQDKLSDSLQEYKHLGSFHCFREGINSVCENSAKKYKGSHDERLGSSSWKDEGKVEQTQASSPGRARRADVLTKGCYLKRKSLC